MNLIAFPARFSTTCRTRAPSPEQCTRQVRRDARRDLEPLVLRARGEQFGGALDQRDEVEGRLDKFQPARFHARQIKDLVDERGQRLARRADRFDIRALLGFQSGPGQQVRHAEHAVERRADFVAHGRKEARLGLAGRFRFREGARSVFKLGDPRPQRFDVRVARARGGGFAPRGGLLDPRGGAPEPAHREGGKRYGQKDGAERDDLHWRDLRR